MPNQRTKQLTHGAMMAAIFTVLVAASVYVPLLNVVTTLFLALPIAWYSEKYGGKASVLLAVAGFLLTFLIGGLLALPLAAIHIPLGLAIGLSIRSGKSKLFLFMASSLVLLFSVIVQYVLTIWLFNINILQDFITTIRETYEQTGRWMERLGGPEQEYGELIAQMIFLLETLLPTLLVISVFLTVWLLLLVNLPVLKRLGTAVPKFPPFWQMKLPKTVLWYYLVVLIVTLFMNLQEGTMAYMAFLNISVLLQGLLFLQGISFYHFYIHKQGWPKWAAVLATILAFPLQSLTGIVGIIDLGFNIRGWVERADNFKGK